MGGKEWYWAGRSSKRGTGGADHQGAETETTTPSSGCMCAVFQLFDFHPFHFPTINQQQESPFKSATSCISEDHTTTVPKGAEAPRNSLESEDGPASLSFLSKQEHFKIPKNIQIKTSGSSGGNLNNDLSTEISSSPGAKTPTLVARLMGLDLLPGANSPSSSCLSTPNPQGNNINIPHLHHLRTKQHSIQTKPRNSTDSSDIAATRSLPETPRISSARRSDVDHHRLSLQINKENMMMMSLGEEDLELPHHRFSFSKRKCDENNIISRSSPSHYARQIVKQVKENVSRKVGQDITNNNTLKSREQAREEFAGQFRVKKSPKTSSFRALDESSSPGKHYSSSCSPRLSRFMDTKHSKPSTATPSPPLTPKDQNTHPNMLKLPPPPPPHPVVNNTQPQLPRVLTKPKPQALPEQQQESSWDQKYSVPKCKKATNEKFSSRLKRPPQTSDIIRNKQEESFIIRPTSPTRANDFKTTKSKKKTQPLSSNLLNNINTVPNLLPVKTDPSPPSTKIPQKQSQVSATQESKLSSQLSSCSRQRYKQEGTTTLATREISTNSTEEDKLNGASFTTGAAEHHAPEFQYITEILNRTNALTKQGTTTTTTVSFFNQWFSPAHPLDPSIFHHLESPNNDKDRNFTPKNQLGHRGNRRLLFDLVDEVLKEILRPKVSAKRLWFLHGFCYHGRSIGELTERVWKRVGEFPCAKCEVLDDIDMLIEAEDMEKVEVEGEEEGEGLVAEIEGNILDTLVHETVMVMDCPAFRYVKISSNFGVE